MTSISSSIFVKTSEPQEGCGIYYEPYDKLDDRFGTEGFEDGRWQVVAVYGSRTGVFHYVYCKVNAKYKKDLVHRIRKLLRERPGHCFIDLDDPALGAYLIDTYDNKRDAIRACKTHTNEMFNHIIKYRMKDLEL